jgi:hypothetical protein
VEDEGREDEGGPEDDGDDTDRNAMAKQILPGAGVVGREVTLLPRHWDWLGSQPGGASVTLRKLVERARKENAGADRVRRAREVAYRFLSAMAGDRPGFEEATRALFAGDEEKFEAETAGWPADVRGYARALAAGAFPEIR